MTFPRLSVAAEAMPLSIFARLYEKLASFDGDVIPLQIGDTYLLPPAAGRLGAQPPGTDRELYAYGPAPGWPPLLEAITAKVWTRNGIPLEPGGVQITAGATHALACAVGALLDPGDEMILLTPHWPLVRGIAQSRSVVSIEVPFSQMLLTDPTLDPYALLARAVSAKTRVIYLCSPNNPDGLVLDRATLEAIAKVAEQAGLWVLSDEVYEDYTYDRPHLSIASLPGMAARTVTVFSFSKSYGQAGLRVGYVVGPRPVIEAVRKMSNHSIYNVPHVLQRAALASLTDGGGFLADAKARYRQARDRAHASLCVPTRLPQGSTYLFLDLAGYGCSTEGCLPVLERIAAAGVLLAPGAPFGAAYADWARLCFTAVPEDRLLEGIARINRVLAG